MELTTKPILPGSFVVVKDIVPLVDIKNNFLIIKPPNGLLEL